MCRLIFRSAAFFLALVALSAVRTPSTVSANPDDTFLVFRFHELQNLGDVDGVLALLTDDAVVSGRGLCAANPCVGKAAIRPEIERAVALHTRITTVNMAVSPNMVVARLEVTNDQVRAAGYERYIFISTFKIKDDKIAVYTGVRDLSDLETAAFAAPLGPAGAGARAAFPSSLMRPPATGDAGLAYESSGGGWVAVAIVTAFAALFAAAATIVRLRRPAFLFIRLS